MKLYLIQHGEATTEEVDPSRPLSAKGRSDVRKIASFLKGAGVHPGLILQSGKTRARQTAEIIAGQLGPDCQVKEREGLGPNDPVKGIISEISGTANDLMVVGHLPFMERLVSYLITGTPEKHVIRFRNAGIACLEYDRMENTWAIRWVLTPEIA